LRKAKRCAVAQPLGIACRSLRAIPSCVVTLVPVAMIAAAPDEFR
tara:strand:+ start:12299 stop:12433 length:135 start_codon:yes stop_codon:yes gene_type:complete